MRHVATWGALASFAVLLAAPCARAQGINPSAAPPALTPAQEQAVEALVARWIAANPAAVRAAIDPVRAADIEDPSDGILGNPAGDLSMVVFVDRASAPSVASMPLLAALAATDPGLRIVLKELPLASRGSVDAALAAVAARRQGAEASRAFEAALMTSPGPADAASAARAASLAGLDAARLAADAADPDARAYLRRTRDLAAQLGVAATPTFLVGGRAIVGARGIDDLRAAVVAARGAKEN